MTTLACKHSPFKKKKICYFYLFYLLLLFYFGSAGSLLWHAVLVDPWHVESSQTRDGTHVPFIAKWILNHWTTRKVPHYFLNFKKSIYFIFDCAGSLLLRVGFLQLVASGATLVVAHGHLIVVTPCCRAWVLEHEGSVVVVQELSCLVACGIFPDQGLNPYPLYDRRILNLWTTRKVLHYFLICESSYNMSLSFL